MTIRFMLLAVALPTSAMIVEPPCILDAAFNSLALNGGATARRAVGFPRAGTDIKGKKPRFSV